MKLRFSKVTVAASVAGVLAAGGAAMAATGTLSGALVSDSTPVETKPAPQVPVPAKPDLPDAPSVPDAKVPDVKVPKPDTKAPAPVPADPALPSVPKPSCSSVPPVVKVGSAVERAFTASSGLTFVDAKAGQVTVRGGQEVCTVTQTWAGKVKGQILRITTLKAPSRTELADLAKGVRMVDHEAAHVGGHAALAGSPSAGGYGVIWVQHKGTAVYVSSSPGLPGGAKEQVKLVAETLQRVR